MFVTLAFSLARGVFAPRVATVFGFYIVVGLDKLFARLSLVNIMVGCNRSEFALIHQLKEVEDSHVVEVLGSYISSVVLNIVYFCASADGVAGNAWLLLS